ncbi:MAG: SdpI family protein [Candidatus ainarchaeum sp.]|nr:SdpI family protein [Candidatus ainarchaeum sp.]
MSHNKNHLIIILIIILFSFLASFYYYQTLPEQIPIHFNANGEIDRYTTKNTGLFFIPLIEIFLTILFILIPLIEPKKTNVKKFIKQYNLFAIVMIGFFAYLHFLILLIAQGNLIDFNQFFVPAIGIVFYFIGIMIKHAKQNYLIGIRTPWTLANEEVWNKTHLIGGNLFKISGIICLFAIFFPSSGFWLILIPISISSITSIVYSYYIYLKIIK